MHSTNQTHVWYPSACAVFRLCCENQARKGIASLTSFTPSRRERTMVCMMCAQRQILEGIFPARSSASSTYFHGELCRNEESRRGHEVNRLLAKKGNIPLSEIRSYVGDTCSITMRFCIAQRMRLAATPTRPHTCLFWKSNRISNSHKYSAPVQLELGTKLRSIPRTWSC